MGVKISQYMHVYNRRCQFLTFQDRPYNRWTDLETEQVLNHFRLYINGSKGNVYPSK